MRALLLLLCSISVLAQQQPTGTVTGHVTCSDTSLPARFATVTLMPIRELPPETAEDRERASKRQGPGAMTFKPVQTRLDGSFVVPHVAPGPYYVIVQCPGYLSPVAQFTQEEIDRPTAEVRALIAKSVPMISVALNQVNLDLRIYRAASLSGTLRYDDGSPVPGSRINLSKRDKAGKWISVAIDGSNRTDDLGHFRIAGLPAQEYLLDTNLSISDIFIDTVFGGSRSSSSMDRYNLRVYFGDTFRKADAKSIKLDEGQDSSGNDLTLPVTKLHSISGSLVGTGTGRVINAGTVTLSTTADNIQVASAKVDSDDPVFRFEFVPEGDYTVRVTDARDVTRQYTPPPLGSFPRPTDTVEMVIRTYGSYEAPFKVETDMTGVNLPIPPKPAKP